MTLVRLYYQENMSLAEIAKLWKIEWTRARRIFQIEHFLDIVQYRTEEIFLDKLLQSIDKDQLTQISRQADYLKNIAESVREFAWDKTFKQAKAELKASKKPMKNSLFAQIICIYKALVNLGKWWDEVFEEGWQFTESIGSKIPNNLTWGYVRSRKQSNRFSISRTKLFDFGLLLQNQTLALIVNLKKEENVQQGVLVQILPHQEEHLPSGLKLKITLNPNTPNSISQEVTARQADNAIQLEFTEALDKQFKVEVSYQDAVVTEEFIL